MGIFDKATSEGLEQERDVLGGRKIYPSDIYIAKIKLAYAIQSDGGALGLALTVAFGDDEYSENIYVTTKEGNNFYVDKNKKKRGLPGYTIANDICLIACDTPLSEVETEEKVVSVYDAKEKGEVNKSVPMLMPLIGKEIALGILEETEFKQEKTDKGYVDTAETVQRNRISKVFHPEYKVTVPEAMDGKEAAFWDAWIKANQGRVVDKTAGKRGGTSSGAKAGSTGASKAPKQSLFGNK